MLDKTFVWKGLTFVWNGRRRKWICERPNHQSDDWWVTHHFYERSFHLKPGDAPIDWDAPPGPDRPELQVFATAGYLAHFGHGDAALRPGLEEALDAALQYAVRFHHLSINELRKVAFATELCGARDSLVAPGHTPSPCSHKAGHYGNHSWEPVL